VFFLQEWNECLMDIELVWFSGLMTGKRLSANLNSGPIDSGRLCTPLLLPSECTISQASTKGRGKIN